MQHRFDRILVMQTGAWIGDVVLMTPALRMLKNAFPKAVITAFVRPSVQELVRRNPYVSDVITYDKRNSQRGFRGFRNMAIALRNRGYDLAVVLHPNSVRSAVLAAWARIPVRIGSNASHRDMFLTHSIPDRTDLHEVHRYKRVLELIGIEDDGRGLEFWHSDDDRRFIDNLLHELGIRDDLPIIGINPSTTWRSKMWSPDRFERLVHLIDSSLEATVVITGAPNDMELASRIAGESRAVNLAGKTDIFQLGALIERCNLFITCDSGPMHIAAAVGTPTIALFGPTSLVRHRPLGTEHVSLSAGLSCSGCYDPHCSRPVCMEMITVDQVINVVREVTVKWKNI